MQYITSRCGKCGKIIRSHSRATEKDLELFGVPFDTCPYCKTILINKHKEFIMMKPFDKVKYHLPSMFWAIPLGFLGAIGGAIISENFAKIGVIIGIILFEIVFYWRCEVNFKEQKEKSIERTKNKEYLNMLLHLNLINQKQYDEFINEYNVK